MIKGLVFLGVLMLCQVVIVLVHFLRNKDGDNNDR